MRRTWIISLLAVGLLLPTVNAIADEAPAQFAMPTSPIRLMSKEAKTFQIKVSGTVDIGYVFVGEGDPNQDSNLWIGYFTDAEVQWLDRDPSTRTLILTLTPRAVGVETLYLYSRFNSVKTKFQVSVEAKELNDFSLSLSIVCRSSIIGKPAACTAFLDVTGSGAGTVGLEAVRIRSNTKSAGWKVIASGKIGPKNAFEFSTPTISGFTQLIAEMDVPNDSTGLDLYPQTLVSLSAPSSVIVGKSFTLSAKADKRFSGTCTVDYRNKMTVKSGAGQIKLTYTSTGSKTLTVDCTGPNWGETRAYKSIYIRG